MRNQLVLFSGLPGCGKTTLARLLAQHIQAPLFAKDRVQRVLRDHVPDAQPVDGYHLLLDLAEEQLSLGLSAILDAVFPLPGFRDAARDLAVHQSAEYKAIYCFCSDEALWRSRMAARVQYTPGWTPVGWEEVVRLRDLFQPWSPDEALFVDAVAPVELNLRVC